jgi:hypothetical protein
MPHILGASKRKRSLRRLVKMGKRVVAQKKRSKESIRRMRLSKTGKNTGKDNPNWKGGIRVRNDGYIDVLNQPRPNISATYSLQHRLVMESYIGRPLKSAEVVHHLNGNRADNRIENLEILSHSEHAKKHGLSLSGESMRFRKGERNGLAEINFLKTHCMRGHAFTGNNLTICKNKGRPFRVCVECKRARQKHNRSL